MQKTNSPPCENSFLDNEDDEFQQTMVRQETFSYQQTPVDFLQTPLFVIAMHFFVAGFATFSSLS